MSDFLQFLTSKEIIVVYIIGFFACLLCFIIYIVEKNNVKRRQRHNTRELNKLVEEIKDEMEEEEKVIYDEPILQNVPIEVIDNKAEEVNKKIDINNNEEVVEVIETEEEIVHRVPDEELLYTTIEPDQVTAQLELKKLTEELEREQEEDFNSKLTSYEEMQEETAIISLDELVKKSKEMYEKNEITQYEDDGCEPISLSELEERVGLKSSVYYEEPFLIENVVSEDENEKVEEKVVEEVSKFKSSPIISPIYGIEKVDSINDLELENTANYEKLDAEIKRTNEFLMSLKELQTKLDR